MKRFLFLMDPFETLNLKTETSLLLMDELIQRGIEVAWIEIEDLCLKDGELWGEVSQVLDTNPWRLAESRSQALASFDALLMRIDPPVNQEYLQLSQLLDTLHVPQFNAVASLRNYNEKLLPLRWRGLAPATIVTASSKEIDCFLQQHGEIVIKPLDDCSGRGIERLSITASSLFDIKAYFLKQPTRFIMAQQYLPEVSKGDKRVFLVDGEALGWVNRVPQNGNFLANIHQGAICVPTTLSSHEKKVVENVRPFLKQAGILFAGLDFIGEYLTEINITSPSAVRQINEVMNINLERQMVDAMMDKIEA